MKTKKIINSREFIFSSYKKENDAWPKNLMVDIIFGLVIASLYMALLNVTFYV